MVTETCQYLPLHTCQKMVPKLDRKYEDKYLVRNGTFGITIILITCQIPINHLLCHSSLNVFVIRSSYGQNLERILRKWQDSISKN